MSKYYYIDDASKQQCGPFQLKDLANQKIRPETMVWRSGMPDWVIAGRVEELAFLFDAKIPVPGEQKASSIAPQANGTSTIYTNIPGQQPVSNNQQRNYREPEENPRRWDDILPMPKNWLIESVLLSIFCCSPISVVGIFYAARVESLYYAKDYDGAMRAANNAKKWALIGILFLPACYVLLTIFFVILGLSL